MQRDGLCCVCIKHMGDMDSVLSLAIWDSVAEAEKLLFSSADNYSIFIVLEILNSSGKSIGHSLANSPIFNAVTHECYSAKLEGISWERIWSPAHARANILADDSIYQLKQAAFITVASDAIFISGIVLLPDNIQADEIFSVDVKHVGDMNSILALGIWDSATDIENLLFQRANAIPVYIVFEFADSDGFVLGHSLTHGCDAANGVNIEWHTLEIDEITPALVWKPSSSNSWYSMCLSCCVGENAQLTNATNENIFFFDLSAEGIKVPGIGVFLPPSIPADNITSLKIQEMLGLK